MKNILLISEFFAPHNTVASIRFSKIVKYLAMTGKYHFWVITERTANEIITDKILQDDIDKVKEYVTIIYVDDNNANQQKLGIVNNNAKSKKRNIYERYSLLQRKMEDSEKKGICRKFNHFFGKIMFGLNNYYDDIKSFIHEISFAKKGIRIIKQKNMGKMDVLITTYGGIGSVLLGLKYKKIYSGVPWISDYRDPVDSSNRWLYILYKKYITTRADRLSKYIVGAGFDCVGSGKYNEKFQLIRNGYDSTDLKYLVSNKRKKFTICYTGTIYYGKQDLSIFFKALKECFDEKSLQEIEFLYAGKQFSILKDQAQRYGMQKILCNVGKVTRKQSMQLQYESDILCLAAWATEESTDNLIGKFMEYLLMKKPIVAIVSGNRSESELKKAIGSANLGYCYEESCHDIDYIELKRFLKSCFAMYKSNGYINMERNTNYVNRFDYQYIAKQYEALINEL